MESSQSSFWQFSDNLRRETNNLSNLSLNDSIWSANYVDRRNFDFRAERRNFDFKSNTLGLVNDIESDLERLNLGFINEEWKAPVKDSGFNNDGWKAPAFNDDGWKTPFDNRFTGFGFNSDDWKSPINDNRSEKNSWMNQEKVLGFGWKSNNSKGIYTSNIKSYSKVKADNFINNVVVDGKMNKYGENESYGKKNKVYKEGNGNGNGENKNCVDKRFKTLPPAESLSKNESIGGYIFVCNNDTMAENLKRQLFGLPSRYRDSVRAITPGLPLFLYNYSTHQLHGIFEAATFGGSNIDPTAWEDKKNPGESRFPSQVRAITRKIYEPLEEDSFRPILHHYDGPKFRLELNIPEVLALLDIFENKPGSQ